MKSFTSLFFSDLHFEYDNFKRIKEYLKKHNLSIDYVFYGGDYDSLKIDEQKDENLVKKSLDFINLVNREVEEEVLGGKKNRLFYVPGNHDPVELFGEKYSVTCGLNVHKKVHNIDENLSVIGFGGSGEGFLEGKKVWEPYPCKNNKELSKEFESFYKSIEKKLETKRTYIILNHFGPNDTKTTKQFKSEKEVVVSGLDVFDKVLKKRLGNFNKFVLHGHTHLGKGRVKYDFRTTMINPGPSKGGNFVLLKFGLVNGIWKVGESRFVDLDSLL